jgi:hypothetical protein
MNVFSSSLGFNIQHTAESAWTRCWASTRSTLSGARRWWRHRAIHPTWMAASRP